MPANSQVEVGERRANTHHGFGESYWKLTKNYSHPTFYKNELQKLKAKGIPVHAFFVRNAAKKNFQEISTTTSGSSKPLDIHSQQGASQLTNLVTEAVLKDIGGSEKGEALVIAYRKSYVK